MDKYQYRVVPTPLKKKGLTSSGDNGESFARDIEELMNALGADGWHYVRADTMPAEERVGFASRHTVFQNVLIFRRLVPGPAAANIPSEVRAEITKHSPRRAEPLLLENPVSAPGAMPHPPVAGGKRSIETVMRDMMPAVPSAPRVVNPAHAVREASRLARKIAAE